MAHIALIKERLVVKGQWITIARFIRVFGVYQILPGPEAAELCMFLGYLAGGRTRLCSTWFRAYAGRQLHFRCGWVWEDASFCALQPMVVAMVNSFCQTLGPIPKTFYAQHTGSRNMLSFRTKPRNPACGLSCLPYSQALNSALRITWYRAASLWLMSFVDRYINRCAVCSTWPSRGAYWHVWSPLRPPMCPLRPLRCHTRHPISALASPRDRHLKDLVYIILSLGSLLKVLAHIRQYPSSK